MSPGRLMSAVEAKRHYGFASIRIQGNRASLLDSDGDRVVVNKNQMVYHRGNQHFGIYTEHADRMRKSKYKTPGGMRDVGKGYYRHKRD